MKKIISAWIEQVVQFDSKIGYLTYISELEQSGKKFKEMDYCQDESGKVTVKVRKQYNNNTFPDS